MIKAVILDIDNTLYDYDAAHAAAFRSLTEYAAEHFGIAPEAFEALHTEAYRVQRERCVNPCAAVHNRMIRCQIILEMLGRPFLPAREMDALYWETLMNHMRPYPGTLEGLERLKALGLTVGVGTNMTADRQFDKLIRLGLGPYIDFMVTSEEVNAEKPDARLFKACAEKAGCEAAECVFVGDSLRGDVQGALNAGMKAVWFCPADKTDYAPRIASLTQLCDLLSSLDHPGA